jgi:chemotaxis protein CheX
VNIAFVNAVEMITVKVFQTMINMSPVKGTHTSQIYPVTMYDVTSIVGLTGSVMGTVSIQLKQKLALQVTSNMLQTQVTAINNDVSDAIGELGNMIAGGLKTELETKGISFNIAIPTVVLGTGHHLGHIQNAESIFYPFFVDNEPFVVSVSLKV